MELKEFSIETDSDGIALVIWDMPDRSMNVIDLAVIEEMERIVAHVSETQSIGRADLQLG